MKRKPVPVIVVVLLTLIASAVLYSLRPLGYTAVSGEPMNIRTEPPETPLTEITIWDTRYPVVFEKSLLSAGGQIKDVYRVSDLDLMRDTYFPAIWVRREDRCILFFEYLHPMKDGNPIDLGDTETDESRRALLEEQLASYCDFSTYDTFEAFHAAHATPNETAGEYIWSVSDESRGLSVTVTEDGYIQWYSYTDNVPKPEERLPLDGEDCERLIRRALRRDGMISLFGNYNITLTCKDMIYFGEAAIFCTARVVDKDGFVFVQSYTIKRQ